TRMLIAAISTTATTTAAMAFFMFGKRRRDGEPPAPDEVLAANAARLARVPASTLVPSHPGDGARLTDESGIPRWRRPSLIEARKADPRYAAVTHDRQSFNHSAVETSVGAERRRIRYRIVSLLDAPDPLRSVAIGDLDEGDEVQLLERSGGYWLVLCPDGSRGWVHRMTLGDVVTDEAGGGGFNAARRSFGPRAGDPEGGGPAEDAEAGAAAGEATEFREVDRSYGEDGTDFLSAYIAKAHRT
ncbi:MAG TPA: SH3 domain-containing protein, partial [Candidatus Limnocylindrales bacterium]